MSPRAHAWSDRLWVGITSSHLGDDQALHAAVCRYLSASVFQCRQSGHVLVVAAESAIEALARRAAELFSVPLITLHVDADSAEILDDEESLSATIHCRSITAEPLQRDDVLISVADRIDAVMVRRGGRVEKALRRRLGTRKDASVRVAIHSISKSATRSLMQMGAIGWYRTRWSESDTADKTSSSVESAEVEPHDDQWMQSENQWLVHCTRAPHGPMPGQTQHQHQDALLLSSWSGLLDPATPLCSLASIVRGGRLLASAIASARQWPVVCFSAASLTQLLQNRCYRPQLRRWDYEPFGVAIRKSAAIKLGVRPVIYGEASQRCTLSPEDQFRFQSKGKTYDWTQEREWRASGDVRLTDMDPDDVRLFVPSAEDAAKLAPLCPWPIEVVRDEPETQFDP
ncbi:hypothetical protein Pla52n_21150 [Stieleria varia]|uniref:Uncharacterized protein n=2 Tax=Stieleria varia TaxID=2528005 RepID=A0A5C6B7C1_9BACT|nr:hypothetical protein Pla52n_21150 [Stieleria varia]